MKTHLIFLLTLLFISNSHETEDRIRSSNLRIFQVITPSSSTKPTNAVTWKQTVVQMEKKDEIRLTYLSSLVAKKSVVPIASGRQIVQSPTYIVKASIGTPAQTMMMAMDINNDAALVPCAACVGCSSSTLFDSSKSTSFKSLGCQTAQCTQVPNPTCDGSACTFNTTYGGSALSGTLAQDTLKLAADPIPNYAFGCVKKQTGTSLPSQGLLGLGRGPLSLLSQSQDLYKSTFSYCLPDFKSSNFSGSLRLGPAGQPVRIKTTPLLRNQRRSSLYYVNLVGIRVGKKVVDIPASAFAFDAATGAGTIFDSGTTFTRLVQPAYEAVRDEFRKRVKNPNVTSLGGFDTCYNVPIVVPTITFMFDGMNVTLPQDNFLIHSSAGSTTCLAMAASPANVNSVLNVIASMQQQNHRILIDIPNSRLGVSRERCT